MAGESGSTHFRRRYESALQAYHRTTGVTLANHPVALHLQGSHSVETITTILKYYEERVSSVLPGSNTAGKLIESIVSMLFTLSANASFGDAMVLSYPPTKAMLAGLAVLFSMNQAAKDANSHHDALVDLLESIEHFLKRIDIYTRVPPTRAMDEMVFNIILELLSMLALATKDLKQGRSIKVVKEGEMGVQAVLQRLDRLTQDEARTTAAQILEVVHGLIQNMRVVMDDCETSADGVRETLEILHQMASDKNKSKRDKLRRNIRCWLSPPDPWKNHNIACGSRHSGTGAWFLQGATLLEWKASGPGSLLWIHGKPGAGKSVLCSAIIEEIEAMRRSGLASLAMFYHDFRENQKKDLRGLLSSILFQLCDQSDTYHNILSKLYSSHRDGAQSPNDDALAQCLKDLLRHPGQAPVYLIIDALDECPSTSSTPSPRENVLKLVVQLIELRLTNLRICVTSRPETDIKVVLQPLTFRSISIHDENGQLEDIENYIRSVINTDAKNRRWRREDKQLVIDVLTERANGMFRWAYCQVDYLRGCHPGSIRQALAELPDTLDETYERTLREIKKADWKLAHRLFQCVAVASRPLYVEELAEFLAFDFQAGPIPKYREDWRLEDPVDAVLSTCTTLLTLVNTKGYEVVQFSHFSVKEFLMSSRFAENSDIISRRYHVTMTPAHTLVAQACLGILLHLDENVNKDSLESFPLIEYAAEYWFEHARFEGVPQNAEEGMKQLFDTSKAHLAIWVWINEPNLNWRQAERPERPETPLRTNRTPLHYAAFCGLDTIVKFLAVKHPDHVRSGGGVNGHPTPLDLASQQGNMEVARILIEHGADVSAKQEYRSTPLQLALEHGHLNLARFLVEHGADVSVQNKFGSIPLHSAASIGNLDLVRCLVEHSGVSAEAMSLSTPLCLASSRGHLDVVQFFVKHGAVVSGQALHEASSNGHLDVVRFLVIEHGADVSAKGTSMSTPLHCASNNGHLDVVRFLIERGANVSAKRLCKTTPLHCASSRGHLDVAQLLIKHGTDVSAENDDQSTPLHRAASCGHLNLVQFLVEKGADLSAKNKYSSTPLHRASTNGHLDVTRFLIEEGVDVSAKNKEGSTPLHLALSRTHLGIALFLIEHGADVSAKDEDGSTPLHLASERGHLNLARFLVEKGADMSAKDKRGWTPLHRAMEHDRFDVAWFLIERTKGVSAKHEEGSTPLHQASSDGHVDLAWFLVEHGADVSAKNLRGSTPLHLALLSGHLDLARFLIEQGADVSAKDNRGSTPLHRGSEHGWVDLAQSLLERGADVQAKDVDGLTALHHASQHGRMDLARFLVKHGADVSARDERGWTPLHRASQYNRTDIACFLVEQGADVSAKDEEGSTPLHRASEHGHIEFSRFLVEKGANVSAKDKRELTPLHRASERASGCVDLAQFLIEHGADVSAKDEDRSTPLHRASQRNHLNLARFLVEHGAEVSAKDKHGSTPLHRASEHNYIDIARVLVDHGADLSAKDERGSTPLHRASEKPSSVLPIYAATYQSRVARFLVERGADVLAKNGRGLTPLNLATEGGLVPLQLFLIERGALTTA